MVRHDSSKQRILESLDLEDTSPFCAFAIEISGGASFAPDIIPDHLVLPHSRTPQRPKKCFLTRLMTLLATAALALAVLFRLSHDYRVSLCVIVSLAALTLVVRSLSAGRLWWALIFLGVLGIFTPFRSGQFSTAIVSVLDLATLALFAASPVMLRESILPAVAGSTRGKL